MRTLDLSPLTAWRNAENASRSLLEGIHGPSALRRGLQNGCLLTGSMETNETSWQNSLNQHPDLSWPVLSSTWTEPLVSFYFYTEGLYCTEHKPQAYINHSFNKAFIEHLLCARHWPGHQWTFRYRFPQHPFLLYIFISTIFTLAWISVRHKNTPLQNQFSVCFYFDINISGLDNIHLKTAVADLNLLFVVQSAF